MVEDIDEPGVAYCGLCCIECRWHSSGECQGCKAAPASERCPTYCCARTKPGLPSCLHCDVFYKDCETWREGMLMRKPACGPSAR